MTLGSDTANRAADAPVWLITGAGRGLGRAFAQAALDSDARVVGTVRTPDALAELTATAPDRVREIVVDVRDRSAVHTAVRAAANAFGRLDVVVNNAGFGHVGTIEELTETDFRDQLDTNLLGAAWVAQAAIPYLRDSGGGDIVQISTVGAIGAIPAFGAYNASKWALEGLSEALALEVAGFGIGVTIAQLGGFATDWAGSSMRFSAPDAHYDELRTQMFGTADVPWPAADPAEPPTDAPARVAADALVAHLARPRADRPLRVLIGADAPVHAGLAYAARRDSYGDDARLDWPGPGLRPA
ncbi:MAG: SDR family NAD(P)-dependent oxidoreductase [Solirubrobacteraceae bacterium]|nr:SDR family NAD(P)-dependent oxidoreductase [Solirubrobacteraceae bacterium]